MKLTFSDWPDIDELNLKRLLLVGSELIFVDRPSISLDNNYFTVGKHSNIRNVLKEFNGSSVKVSAHEPPNTTINSAFYRKYFERDVENPDFIEVLFKGVEANWIYDPHFNPASANTEGEFKDYRTWLLSHKNEITKLNINSIERPDQVFNISNKQEALFAFKMLAAEQSLRVTSVIHVCHENNSNPTSISPYLDKLISLRLSSGAYNKTTTNSRQLGLKLMDCVIPDEALIQIPWQEILEFREVAKDYYDNWMIEVSKLESTLFKDNFSITEQDAHNLFNAEINPRLLELKHEIRRIRDERFNNILKTVKNVTLSSIGFGTLSSLSIAGAVASFIGANLKTPKLTDDVIDAHFKLKDKQLSNGLTYLLKLQEFSGKQ